MSQAKVKTPLLLLLGIIVGLAIGLGYGQMTAQKLEKTYEAKIKDVKQRFSHVQRQYQEEKDLKASLESDKQTTQDLIDKLTKEKTVLSAARNEQKSKADLLESKIASLEKKSLSLENQNGKLTERLSKTEADRKEWEQKERQASRSLQDREKELKQRNQKYDECAQNNARLYTLANEVLAKYEKKGVLTTLVEKEPFTQVKKVELEKLVQDYKDKIEQQKMHSK